MDDMRQGTCPLCGHDQIIHATSGDFGGAHPLAVVRARHEAFEMAFGADLETAFGILSIYVCRRCGHAQWAASEPEKVPIGEKYGTRLLPSPLREGPYR